MQATFLGTGTSHGIPVIGCRCPVCTSGDPRNQRTRCSLVVRTGRATLLIDTATELRLQAVREGLAQVDAVLFTHPHADHIGGMDDLRRFNEIQGRAMPCYGNLFTLDEIRKRFDYIFRETQLGGGKPQLELHQVEGTAFALCGLAIQPVPIWHGRLPILGYRFADFAYLTDCSEIPVESLPLLQGLEVLVLGALRYRPHPTHFSLAQALEVVMRLQPRRALFTHICHDLDHQAVNATLPEGIELAHDGLSVEW